MHFDISAKNLSMESLNISHISSSNSSNLLFIKLLQINKISYLRFQHDFLDLTKSPYQVDSCHLAIAQGSRQNATPILWPE